MAKCFILCNLNNPKSDYIISSYAGSSISYYLGDIVSDTHQVIFINVGATCKKWSSKSKHNVYSHNDSKIIEFNEGCSFLPTRIKSKLMIKQAVKYIINNSNSSDFVLVYHSISFSPFYNKILQKFGINRAILHVAEFYSDVGNIKFSKKKEINSIKLFKKHIFMSKGLLSQIQSEAKNNSFAMLYGVYDVKPCIHNDSEFFDVVYAGTTSKIKGGLFNALNASKFLPNNYRLHIFCRANIDLIDEIKGYPVIYEGYVTEDELNKKLVTYDIGLASQNPNSIFNNSSFPSKIVNYLSCGLNVVSSKSISVIDSPFKDKVYFYEYDETGEELANAIIKASKTLDKIGNCKMIQEMDSSVRKDVKKLFIYENTRN